MGLPPKLHFPKVVQLLCCLGVLALLWRVKPFQKKGKDQKKENEMKLSTASLFTQATMCLSALLMLHAGKKDSVRLLVEIVLSAVLIGCNLYFLWVLKDTIYSSFI